MTQPQDPRKHPLQDDEIALARVLRALPASEPSAPVDDAILRAAIDAVPPSRRKPAPGLRWLPTWAIGTAAAAVLAVGIGVQLRPPLNQEAAPASVSDRVQPLPQAEERLSVEWVEPDQASTPRPTSAPPEARRATRAAPSPPPPPLPSPLPPPPSSAAPEAFPAPPSPAPAAESADASLAMDAAAGNVQEVERRVRSDANDQARRVHQEAYARRAPAKASAPESAAQSAAAPAPIAATTAPAGAAPSPRVMADAPTAPVVLPPVVDDAKLAPAAWFDRIRDRRRQGDTVGARASLRLLLQVHPEAPIPGDLARLR